MKNTIQASNWVVKVFKDWVTRQNLDVNVVEKCPIDLLENENIGVDALDKWLAMFVLEVRKSDGTYYSPTSLKGLLAGIQRYMKEKHPVSVPKMLSRNDSSFVKLMNALDGQLRMLRSAGSVSNQSEVFTKTSSNDCGSLECLVATCPKPY